jgi:hypothetical protein
MSPDKGLVTQSDALPPRANSNCFRRFPRYRVLGIAPGGAAAGDLLKEAITCGDVN